MTTPTTTPLTTSFELFALTAGRQRMTKTFHMDGTVTSYPMVRDFSSVVLGQVFDFPSFATLLQGMQHMPNACLIKGALTRTLAHESRAGSTDPYQPTQWVVLDFDGLPVTDVDTALRLLQLDNISHVIQYSASSGRKPGVRAHVYMLLDTPQNPAVLSLWLRSLNLEYLKPYIGLTSTGQLSWPLDVTSCNSDRLIFTAPPDFEGGSDSLPVRWSVERRAMDTLRLSHLNASTFSKYLVQSDALRDSLRQQMGLAPIRKKLVSKGAVTYQPMPTPFTCTGVKQARGWTYYNINGGDSWAYYHPDDAPTYLHNFKGEPNYLMAEVLPEQHAAALARAPTIPTTPADDTSPSSPPIYPSLVFADASNVMYTVTYPAPDHRCVMNAFPHMAVREAVVSQLGLRLPDPMPVMQIVYDPTKPHGVQPSLTGVVPVFNKYYPSDLMRLPPTVARGGQHPNITMLLRHLLSEDDALEKHFLNWLAFAIQRRTKTQTAWLFRSTQGAGKNTFYSEVIRPLVGASHASMANANQSATMSSDLNIHELLFMLFDETHIGSYNNHNVLMSRFKTYITEPTMTIKRLYSDPCVVNSYMNCLFFSNDTQPLVLEPGDRRFNIPPVQTKPLTALENFDRDALPRELDAFYATLMLWDVDETAVRTVMDNEARRELIHNSRTDRSKFFEAITNGDLSTLAEAIPTSRPGSGPSMDHMRYEAAIEILREWIRTPPDRIPLDELAQVYGLYRREATPSSLKMGSSARLEGIQVKPMRVKNAVRRCIEVNWNIPADELENLRTLWL